uniref:Uncharacterized protein n=1 Tax=Odontella aurita TaxID=265563 RepID=A0A7S4JM02_9STRA|mmetsp:Transcript_4915/g.13993  ORF Transcript_4915/g.13993 Transcript_4915/m.13993 type:complete len:667 (+) Transcript_4915:475-2475(+)
MPTRIIVREPPRPPNDDRSYDRRRRVSRSRSRSRSGSPCLCDRRRRGCLFDEHGPGAADEETGRFGRGGAGAGAKCTQQSFDRRAMLANYRTSDNSRGTRFSSSRTHPSHPSSSSERSAAQRQRRRSRRSRSSSSRAVDHRHRHLSSTDIAASPRLVGCVYMATAGLVCALNAMLFQRNLIPGVELFSGGRRGLASEGSLLMEHRWGRRYLVPVVGGGRGRRRRRTTTTIVIDSSSPESVPNKDDEIKDWRPSMKWHRLLQQKSPAPGGGNATSSMATAAAPSVPPGPEPTTVPSARPTFPPTTLRSPTILPSRAPSTVPSSTVNPSTQMPTPHPSGGSLRSPGVTSDPAATSRPSAEQGVNVTDEALPSEGGNNTLAPAGGTESPPPSPSSSPSANLTASAPNVSTSAPSSSLSPSLSPAPSSTFPPTQDDGMQDTIPPPPPQRGCLIGDCQAGPLPMGAVVKWKMWTAIFFPAGLCFLACAVVAVHFDKTCFPNFWKAIFRDGSVHERNFLIVLAVLWGFSLYACTSANSVGTFQPNVFFSSWAGFASVLLTWGIMWREGADRPTVVDAVRDHPRLTTFNWMCTAACSGVSTLTVVDLYVAERMGGTYHDEKLRNFTRRDWLAWLLVPCATAVWSSLAPLTSHLTARRGVKRQVRLAWRQVEGV